MTAERKIFEIFVGRVGIYGTTKRIIATVMKKEIPHPSRIAGKGEVSKTPFYQLNK